MSMGSQPHGLRHVVGIGPIETRLTARDNVVPHTARDCPITADRKR
jgi:hypothetical protein